MVAVCIAFAVDRQVMYTLGSTSFINSWGAGKLTGCEGDFACLICTSGGSV